MVAEVYRISVSGVAGLDLGKSPTKSAQDSGESAICSSKCLKMAFAGQFRKMRWQNAHKTEARDRFALQNCTKYKTEAFGALLEDEVGKMCTRL